MPIYNKSDRVRISGKPSFRNVQRNALFRDEFHDDVARLVHSASYRRLARKRQLLPDHHSDFVRNRLTHSNEVAQIATSIGNHLNNQMRSDGLNKYHINADVLVFAGLAHDIGHPPFGHLGEVALNAKMQDAGGFEGNAQSIRVIARLEQRLTSHDTQGPDGLYNDELGIHGLNVTARSLASIIKYNKQIPVIGFDQLRLERDQNQKIWQRNARTVEELRTQLQHAQSGNKTRHIQKILEEMDKLSAWNDPGEHPAPRVVKGYYEDDHSLVEKVLGHVHSDGFVTTEESQTIECQIMDLADDVAYSIYDLEDCLKTGFVTPERLMSVTTDDLRQMAAEVIEKIWSSHKRGKISDTFGKALTRQDLVAFVTPDLLIEVVFEVLGVLFVGQKSDVGSGGQIDFAYIGRFLRAARNLATDGKIRRKLTDFHILHCCASAEIKINEGCPAASTLCYPLSTHVRIETLKRLNFHLVINSDVIQADEHRGESLVSEVFDGLYLPCDEFKVNCEEITGYQLLPDDVRDQLRAAFDDTRQDILEVRQSVLTVGDFLEELVRKHPIYRKFSLHRMLHVKDYHFRYSLATSIYEVVVRDGPLYSQKHAKLRSRRTSIKRIICDFIAGMTDRGLVEFHSRMRHEDNRNVVDQYGN